MADLKNRVEGAPLTAAQSATQRPFLSALQTAMAPAQAVAEEKAKLTAEQKSRFDELAGTEPAPVREMLTEKDLEEFFAGHTGQAKLAQAILRACNYARAQAPREEITAILAITYEDWPPTLADRVYEFASDAIMKARLAARAEVRMAIYEAAFDTEVKPGQIGLLKAFAFEHLDWSREPIDAQMKKALRQAEEEIAKGNMQ